MEALKEAAKPESEPIIEEYRRGRLARMEKFLPFRGIAEGELAALEKAFADAHEQNPDLGTWVYMNESPPPTGPGSLHFRELANRAAWTLAPAAGEDGWKSWLDVLVGYLLKDDLGEEYIRALQASHLDRPEGTTPETHPGVIIHGENYEIRHLSKASEHCCRWLQRRWQAGTFGADATTVEVLAERRRETRSKLVESANIGGMESSTAVGFPKGKGTASDTQRSAIRRAGREQDPQLRRLRSEVRKMHEARLSQREMCTRLSGKPRPPGAMWRDLDWPAAFKNRKYSASVRKWLSSAAAS